MEAFELQPGALDLATLRRIYRGEARPVLASEARAGIEASAAVVERVLESGRTVYGINTGFGLLARERIAEGDLRRLQRNLVLSHAAGTGPALPDAIVRLTLALKLGSLGRGFSGVRPAVVDALEALIAAELWPVVPAKGSVGASGDLAPLAHLALPLIGEGVVRWRGEVLTAREGLARAGLDAVELGPKEGLALLNGTQVSTALALAGLFEAELVFDAAVLAGALSVDAARGSDVPFDARIHALRGQPGQVAVAAVLRRLLAGSAVRESHRTCPRVQDPYCLRCQPQVMGAALDLLRQAAGTLAIEANAVTDNPLVLAEDGEIVSGGNFHGEPVAFAADQIAIALAEVGNLSERRTAMLIDPTHNGGLPAFLVERGGLNSGFMLAQVTAAALASENKGLAVPASVDTIPTSAGQEDHVAMSTRAGYRLAEMVDNAAAIVGVELLAAAQGIEFHRPLGSSPPLEATVARVRQEVPRWEEDREFAPDLARAKAMVTRGAVRTVETWW